MPRQRIWLARCLASLGSVALVALGTAAFWAALLAATGGPAPGRWIEPVRAMAIFGAPVTLVAFLGGIAAASLLGAPLIAVIVGLLLALLPFGLAALLVRFFPFARVGFVAVGFIVPLVLPGGYLVSSWLASCRGEPAGRHRARLGAGTLVLALLLAGALFVIAAPLAMRLDTLAFVDSCDFDAAPAGGAGLLGANRWSFSDRGVWLVDTTAARRTRFIPPPTFDIGWKRDGTVLAVPTKSGPLGSESDPRIEFMAPSGQQVFPPWRLPPADADLFVSRPGGPETGSSRSAASRRESSASTGSSRRTGRACSLDLNLPVGQVGLAGFDGDGRPVLSVGSPPAAGETVETDMESNVPYELRRFDAARCAIEPTVLARGIGHPFSSSGTLSPTGRFWLRGRTWRAEDQMALVDLETGVERPAPRGEWLAGDALVWVAVDGPGSSLMIGKPGEAPRTVRTWSDARAFVEPSPDRLRLLVWIGSLDRSAPEVPAGQAAPSAPWSPVSGDEDSIRFKCREEWVYEVAGDRWIPLPLWDGEQDCSSLTSRGWYFRQLIDTGTCGRSWAGPRTLMRYGQGLLAFEEFDRPGSVRFLIGGPGS